MQRVSLEQCLLFYPWLCGAEASAVCVCVLCAVWRVRRDGVCCVGACLWAQLFVLSHRLSALVRISHCVEIWSSRNHIVSKLIETIAETTQ